MKSKKGTPIKKISDAGLQVYQLEKFFFFHKRTQSILSRIIIISLVGVKALRDVGVDVVSVDPCSDPECVAESAALTAWRFQGLKSESKRKSEVEIVLHSSEEKRYIHYIITKWNMSNFSSICTGSVR